MHPSIVLPALVAGINVFLAAAQQKRVDGPRIKSGGDKPGQDS
jgi:hypothetical protein